jgi:hypothetical protein
MVETEEDFGAQGSAPTNPELLDWLAAEYRDRGWSLKRLISTIVLSDDLPAGLRDHAEPASRPTHAICSSRGARFRLCAETIRDQALGCRRPALAKPRWVATGHAAAAGRALALNI